MDQRKLGNCLYINFGTVSPFGSLLPFVERKRSNRLVELLGNHRGQSQQSRLELGLRLSRGVVTGEGSSLPTYIAVTGSVTCDVRKCTINVISDLSGNMQNL